MEPLRSRWQRIQNDERLGKCSGEAPGKRTKAFAFWSEAFWKLAANLLSASRFFLAALWLAAYASGNRRPALLGPIALAGAASDFADGRLARQTGSPRRVRTMARRHCRYRFRSHGSLMRGARRIDSRLHPRSDRALVCPVRVGLRRHPRLRHSRCEPPRPLGRRHQLRSGDHARMRAAAPLTGAARPPGRTPHRDSLSRRDHRACAQLPAVAPD